MKCQRCGGLTVGVTFFGGVIATEAWEYDGWKCLNCGFISDPRIVTNKTRQSQSMRKHESQSNYHRATLVSSHVAAKQRPLQRAAIS